MRNQAIEVIVRGCIISNGKLLTNHTPKNDFCYLPGGHLEYGESLTNCLQREIMEEAGIRVEVKKLLDVSEHFFSDRFGDHHEINIIFSATVTEKDAKKIKQKEAHVVYAWVPIKKIQTLNMLPKRALEVVKTYLKTTHHH